MLDHRFARFDDFSIEIRSGEGRSYPLRISGRAGEMTTTLQFPFDDLVLENRLQALQIAILRSSGIRRRIPSPEEQRVNDFGQALFDALFSGDARLLYEVSLRDAAQAGRGVRIKLNIQAPELATLPWEFLYDARRHEYVALSHKTPVVRTFDLPQPVEPLELTLPLRILGMIAAPFDLPELDIERERARVEGALRNLREGDQAELVWVEGQRWRDLQRMMRSGPWHVFHFIGHGGFDIRKDEGYIALVDEKQRADPLHATQLGRLMADHPSLRLVLLNSCASAQSSMHDLFSSTAATLVRRNIPAVLAMQYPIADQAAIEFAHTFYEALADGLSLAAALTEARIAVSVAIDNSLAWGAPVLYMRGADEALFAGAAIASLVAATPKSEPQAIEEATAQPSKPGVTETTEVEKPIRPIRLRWVSLMIALILFSVVLFAARWLNLSPFSLLTEAVPTETLAPTTMAQATKAPLMTSTSTNSTSAPTASVVPALDAASLVAQAKVAINDKAYGQARQLFEAAVQAGCNCTADAISFFSNAANERDPEALFHYGLLTAHIGINEADNYEKVISLIENALHLQPDPQIQGQYYAARAEIHYQFNHAREALLDDEQALKRITTADRYGIYMNRVDIYNAMGENCQALANLNLAIQAKPEVTDARDLRSRRLSKTNILLCSTLDDQNAITQPAAGVGSAINLGENDAVLGKEGNGISFNLAQSAVVTFPIMQDGSKNVDFAQGEVEFWYKSNFDAGAETAYRKLFLIGSHVKHRGIVLYVGDGTLTLLVEVSTKKYGDSVSGENWNAPLWKAGQWVKIRARWDTASDSDALQIYVDEKKVDEQVDDQGGWDLQPEHGDAIYIGTANSAGGDPADGVIDEFLIRGLATVEK